LKVVPIKKAIEENRIHLTMATAYKWHSTGKNPELIFKFAGKLCTDLDAWDSEAKKARDAHVKKCKKVRE
jgi:hypothetical protein